MEKCQYLQYSIFLFRNFAVHHVMLSGPHLVGSSVTPTCPSHLHSHVYTHKVKGVLRAVNTWKATGPHGVSDRVLECADQLTRVTTNVFNWSLSQICHHRPNAKNPLLRASMNSTHSSHCKKLGEAGPPTLDRHQFAYRANIFTGEAIITALHTAIPHLGAHQVGLCQTALRRF